VLAQHEQVELVPDPLRRDDIQAPCHPFHGVHHSRRRPETQRRDEPGRAQHAQGVVREGGLGMERCVQDLGRQRLEATVRVEELSLRKPDRHGVDREVSAGQVDQDVLAERDVRLAFVVRVDLLAERGDLDAPAVLLGPHRPKPRTLHVFVVGPATQQACGLVGMRAGGEIDLSVVAPPTQEVVAHGSSHQVQLVSGRAEPLSEVAQDRFDVEPSRSIRGFRGTRLAHDAVRIPSAPFESWAISIRRLGVPM
jgi:hypothetical protein